MPTRTASQAGEKSDIAIFFEKFDNAFRLTYGRNREVDRLTRMDPFG
jgi:hypothetical protein